MSDALEQSIVSLLEERVELAISTVQQLRAEKLELEAEISRLTSDLLQRDGEIQNLEDRNSDLKEELGSERAATSDERSEIRERLAGLMDVLIASDESPVDTNDEITFEVDTDEVDTNDEITFEVDTDEVDTNDEITFEADTDEPDAEATEAEASVRPRVFRSI
jgi:chromosome segregation ATPase